ncbi:MAG: NAD(P)-dependent oxidoreductase [Pirellulaceae bacterium]
MPTILITGASGFIGGRAVQAFVEGGWRVIGLGRRPNASPNYLQIDLAEAISTKLISQLGSVDVILHAAARSAPWGKQRDFLRDNVAATKNVLKLAEQLRQPKLIFVSSSSVYYEKRDQYDISESTSLASHPVNIYAATKQTAEAIVRRYSGPWCVLRPRAVYGRGDSVLFPRILAAAQAGRLPLLVRRGQPAIGDLLSIDNLIHCFRQAAEKTDIVGDFNLTDGQPVEIIPFLLNIFQKLEIPQPRRKLSVRTAFAAAYVIERVYSILWPTHEPPITPFGVHVFAYSKTFDVTKMQDTFGPLPQTVEKAVQDFAQWVQAEDPYRDAG